MIEFILIGIFLIVLAVLSLKDQRDMDHTDKFLDTFLKSIEDINDTCYKTLGKVNEEHFEELRKNVDKMWITSEKILDKQNKIYEKNVDKLLKQNTLFIDLFNKRDTIRQTQEQIERIITDEPNKIEQAQEREDPLADFPHLSPDTKMNIQFEGEEQILPIELE